MISNNSNIKEKMGIGVDVVSISRVTEKLILNKPSLEKWFFISEIDYCMSKPNPKLHFAGKFAAKEAVIKAISQSLNIILGPRDIEIISDGHSAPKVTLHSEIVIECNVLVSISHTHETATAFAISLIS